MKKAAVSTPWAGAGTLADPYHPRLLDEYAITSYSDVTVGAGNAMLPSPNLVVIEILCADATLTAIDGDQDYYVHWSENA